jgi:DNA-binding protein H-NS
VNVAKSLNQINSQIAKLRREADALKAKEATGVISRIREAIDHYGLTASDLGLGVASARRGRPPGKPARGRPPGKAAARKPARRAKSKTTGVIKYRDEAGNSWTGHGRSPSWYKLALESGKTPDDLLVK